jgi:hypothetical protein
MEGPQEGTPERLLLRIPEVAEVLEIGHATHYFSTTILHASIMGLYKDS